MWGLGNRKQLLVEDELERAGVEVVPGLGGVGSASSGEAGLHDRGGVEQPQLRGRAALRGITNLFDTRVDGETALELDLPGKPAPDSFLEAARRLAFASDARDGGRGCAGRRPGRPGGERSGW